MKVSIKNLKTSKTFDVALGEEPASVEQLKQAIQDREGIEVASQRLVFKGKTLRDGVKLADVGVEDGARLHLVIKLTSATAPAADAAGNVYDDAAPPPPRDPLSKTMKERLIRESAGLGADPNQKNPFLPVFFGVGVFVLLGALAVNM